MTLMQKPSNGSGLVKCGKPIRLAPLRLFMGWIVMCLEWCDDEHGSLKPDEKRIDISIDEMLNLFHDQGYVCTITKLVNDHGDFDDAINVECARTPLEIGTETRPVVSSYEIGKLAESVGGEGWSWVKTITSSDGVEADTQAFLNDAHEY